MTPEQLQMIQASFAQVAPHAEAVAAQFYARLFELDPELEMLFRADLQEQGRKLMSALTLLVAGQVDAETVAALAQRHVAYGVEARHYATVGQALLDTLAAGLGDAWTPELKQAWVDLYTGLAGQMQAAAYPQPPATA